MFFDCICALIIITAKTKTKDIQKKIILKMFVNWKQKKERQI